MIIKKVELYNFRQYKGKQTIEFTIDSDRNVTVLIGKNTSGKTTFVQAFNWCLYEKSNFKSKDIINLEVVNSLRPLNYTEAYVEIVLEHEFKEYTIRRSQRFDKGNNDGIRPKRSVLEVQYKDKSGSTQNIPQNEYDNTINKILPEELSDYFFFDGERLGKINNKGDVVSAVRALMGLDVVCEARERLNPSKSSSVTSKFNNELDIGSDNKNVELKKRLESEQNNLEKFNIQLDTCINEIDYFERRKIELQNKLLEKKEVKSLKEREVQINSDIEYLKNNIEQNKKRIKKIFGVDSTVYFSLPLINRALDILNGAKTDAEGIPDMRVKAIDHIITRGKCLCGRDLMNDEEAIENIIYEKSLLPPQHMGTIIGNYKKTLNRWKGSTDGKFEYVMEQFKELKVSIDKLEMKKVDKENIHKKVLEFGNADVTQLENDFRSNSRTLNEKNNTKSLLDRKIGACEKEIQSIEGQIKRLAVVNEKNRKVMRYLDYSNAIFKWFDESYLREEKEVKEKLLESVNRNFKKMYHGNREVTLNDKYQINLETKVGDYTISTDESKGLEAVKNFSFVTGLVDLARERAREKVKETDNIFYSEPYPLVMDAPFSNVDEIHIDNIANILPDSAEQVILILMKKDWKYAEKSIGDRIGDKYIIEKVNNSETYSSIRPL